MSSELLIPRDKSSLHFSANAKDFRCKAAKDASFVFSLEIKRLHSTSFVRVLVAAKQSCEVDEDSLSINERSISSVYNSKWA